MNEALSGLMLGSLLGFSVGFLVLVIAIGTVHWRVIGEVRGEQGCLNGTLSVVWATLRRMEVESALIAEFLGPRAAREEER